MAEAIDQSEKAEVEGKAQRRSWKLAAGGLVLALLTAILTGAVSYAYGVVNDVRKTKLDFVNAQIEKLYGPLYAASQASNAVWMSFTKYHWRYPGETQGKSGAFFTDSDPPTVDQVRRWRHWIRTVLQPLNFEDGGGAHRQLSPADRRHRARRVPGPNCSYRSVQSRDRDLDRR